LRCDCENGRGDHARRPLFGTDRFDFSVTSDAELANQKTRTFTRFSDAAREVVEARILLGIHFRFADEVARTQGTRVADWTFSHALRPLTSKPQ
jgi:hypothetical protein